MRGWKEPSHRWPFRPLVKIVQEGECDGVKIDHFEISEEEAKSFNLRCFMSPGGARERVVSGRYCRLLMGGAGPMMSDTPFEQQTCRQFVNRAEGDVLIGGLGIGMVLDALLSRHRRKHPTYSAKPTKIRSILVVEKDYRVINLIAPYFKDRRLRIVEGDVFEWKPEKGQKFDTIWFDIWPTINEENLPEIARLHQRAKYWKRSKDSFMASWEADWLKDERRRDQARGPWF